jgi:hypothetical protein
MTTVPATGKPTKGRATVKPTAKPAGRATVKPTVKPTKPTVKPGGAGTKTTAPTAGTYLNRYTIRTRHSSSYLFLHASTGC